MQALKKLLVKLLRETADKINADTCEMTETEAMDIMRVLAHESLSKEQAMLEAYEVEDAGEAPAYTIGYLVGQMWKIFKGLL